MSGWSVVWLAGLLVMLPLAAYADRIYSEMGRFLSREFQDNIDAWESLVEPRLRLERDTVALTLSLLRQVCLAGVALVVGLRLAAHGADGVHAAEVLRAIGELVVVVLLLDRLLPQILFTRTEGRWARRLVPVLQGLLWVLQPVVLFLGLLLSIVALAEPEDETEEEHPSEAMDALLEAGEEEGILEESDRELVRSVVEFGDKLVREVMTPRPEIYAVPGAMTLEEFTRAVGEHGFSRVPVYGDGLDDVTGIAFAHDLLQVADTDARERRVAEMQRPAAFVPETKNTAELLREMQREKQHMRVVIDEYGGVAGLVTIEDLLEAIVGEIHDEHDTAEDTDSLLAEPDGSLVGMGTVELPALRDVLLEQLRTRLEGTEEDTTGEEGEGELRADRRAEEERWEDRVQRLGDGYEATTLGGLVSEMAGHIPHPGEVVEEEGLRFEVLAGTDRRVDRVRVKMGDVASR